MTKIGGWVFSGCSSLTSITIPDSVTSIDNYAFYHCSSLTSITIPDSVTSIEQNAFHGCSSLADITIPAGITMIGEYAFGWCRNLAEITIPDSITNIGDRSFWSSGLNSITIPDSVKSIGEQAFGDCVGLLDVYYTGTREDKENIIILDGNEYLLNATWHFPGDMAKIYTVVFNTNEGSSISSQTVETGKTTSKPADPTKDGYTFAGWCSDEALANEFDFSTPITSDITLYAKWTATKYTVTFNTNGGSAISSQAVETRKTAEKPADPTKGGYSFAGWYSDEALTSAFDFSTSITSDITLYAKWTDNPTPSTTCIVNFETKGGSAISSQTVKTGKTASKPADPLKGGYKFAGWYSDETLTTAFDFSTPITSDITLYAKWVEIPAPISVYQVKFSTNRGSWIDTQEVETGKTAEKPADPTKDGYTFAGWYSDEALANEFYFSTPITSDITVYARWTEAPEPVQTDISTCTVSAIENKTYTGKALTPAVTVKNGNETLKLNTDYTVSYSGNKEAGTATVIITYNGNYTGTKTITFKIAQANNSYKSATLSKSLKKAKVKKKKQTFKIAAKFTFPATTTYKVSKYTTAKAKKYITISKKGVVTVKKGTPKGTYKVKVKITAAATKNVKAKTVAKTVKVVVK